MYTMAIKVNIVNINIDLVHINYMYLCLRVFEIPKSIDVYLFV